MRNWHSEIDIFARLRTLAYTLYILGIFCAHETLPVGVGYRFVTRAFKKNETHCLYGFETRPFATIWMDRNRFSIQLQLVNQRVTLRRDIRYLIKIHTSIFHHTKWNEMKNNGQVQSTATAFCQSRMDAIVRIFRPCDFIVFILCTKTGRRCVPKK